MTPRDPYSVLGISAGASDAELRAAYRRAVQRHHPDHNGGSPESARRFEEVQEAYTRIRTLRASRPRRAPPTSSSADPRVDARLAAMEQELAAARDAREAAQRAREAAQRARQAAQAAARAAASQATSTETGERPSDEELGYIHTEDSFTKIVTDAAAGFSERLEEERRGASQARSARRTAGRATHRLADLIDELGEKLTGEPGDKR